MCRGINPIKNFESRGIRILRCDLSAGGLPDTEFQTGGINGDELDSYDVVYQSGEIRRHILFETCVRFCTGSNYRQIYRIEGTERDCIMSSI
jgi:hypothetical protein